MLADTQNKIDNRDININKVGIKDIKHPLIYINNHNKKQHSIGNWQMTVSLSPELKGTHMSRFVEILNQNTIEFSTASFADIVKIVVKKLQAKNAEVIVNFPLFINKLAPVSKVQSMLDYNAKLCSNIIDGRINTTITVVVAVTSLCPCSKSIASYGAHNQRSHITISATIKNNAVLHFEELIAIAEKHASCDLYAILKREDEKEVTEKAYNNPAFVEDLVRNISIELNNNNNIATYTVESENFESIHNHSAYAFVQGK